MTTPDLQLLLAPLDQTLTIHQIPRNCWFLQRDKSTLVIQALTSGSITTIKHFEDVHEHSIDVDLSTQPGLATLQNFINEFLI